MAASITLRPPITLVWMASKGLYSHAGTCLSAAACTTTVTPENARASRCGSRTSPRKYRRLGWSNPAHRISCCLSSSRLKTISFCGRYSRSINSVNFLPKDPVPPVTSTTCSDQFIVILVCLRVEPDYSHRNPQIYPQLIKKCARHQRDKRCALKPMLESDIIPRATEQIYAA